MTLGLLDASEKVVVLDNLSTGFDWAVADPAKLVVGDTGDAELQSARLLAEHKIDAVAHFAAKIVVPEVQSPIPSATISTTLRMRALSSRPR